VSGLAKMPLAHQPGEVWEYSWGVDVLARVVELASGQAFDDFLQARIFKPLGMVDTGFYVPQAKLARLVDPLADGWPPLWDVTKQPKLFSGGGGLVSTAHDYMRFCQMLVHGGALDGVQILSPKTVALFSLNYLQDNQQIADMAPPGLFSEAGYAGVGFSIGCGVTIDVAKTRLPGTEGEFMWGGAASTAFWVDPKEELAVVFMTQVIGSDARLTLRRDLRTLVYSAMTESFA